MTRAPTDRSRRVRIGGAAAAAGLGYALVMFWPLLTARPGPLQSLRTAYWHDQLGYLSIVANAAAGDVDAREPMTTTGVNYYPRTYYTLVGIVARTLSAHPVLAWNLVSVLLQVAAVVVLAVTMSTLARRWWIGLLAPLPFFTGTLSTLTGGGWSTPLASHAVLWGPYGVTFSNNAETAGLCVIIIVLCLIALTYARPSSRRARIAVGIIAAVLLGILSGFQTYSFLTGVYAVTAVIVAVLLMNARWWWSATTALAIVAVTVLGPLVADRFGQLPTLVFGLLPAVPGIILGVIRSRGLLALYGVIMTAFAAPPIIWTLSGILGGDPFLTYRVASNSELGVVDPSTLVASLPVVVPFVALVAIAAARRDRVALGALFGLATAAALLVTNDLWGANAEPYRFWINFFLIGGVGCALVAARLVGTARIAASEPSHVVITAPPARSRGRIGLVVLSAAGAAVYVLSLLDFGAFTADSTMSATWDPSSPRDVAISDAARQAGESGEGLVTVDACIDARTMKVDSAAPVAAYYLGMAWPAEVDAVTEVMGAATTGVLQSDAVRQSDTGWLLTDTRCDRKIILEGITAEEVASYPYDESGDAIRLWRILPD